MSSVATPEGPRRPRRSARSKAGSEADQSVATAVTAGGSKSARKGPLSKVKARNSNAYGAAGRLLGAEQLHVNQTGFIAAFETQRGEAVARDESQEPVAQQVQDAVRDPVQEASVVDDDDDDDEHLMSGALSSRKAAPKKTPKKTPSKRKAPVARSRQPEPQPTLVVSDDLISTEGDTTHTTSAYDTSKSFGLDHEGGMTSNSGLRPPASSLRQNLTKSPAPVSSVPVPAPWPLDPHELPINASRPPITRQVPNNHTTTQVQARVQQYAPTNQLAHDPVRDPVDVEGPKGSTLDWPWLLKWGLIIFGGLLIAMLCGSALQSDPSASTESSLTSVLGARASYQWSAVKDWMAPAPRFTPGPDDFMWSHLIEHERKLQKQAKTVDEVKESLGRFLDGKLPQYVVVKKDRKGDVIIPDELWRAIANRVRTENLGGSHPNWDDFIKENVDKVRELWGKPLDITYSSLIPHIISDAEFVKLLEKQYERMSQHVDKQIDSAIEKLAQQMKTVASKEARKVSMDQVRMESLALTNLAYNTELTMTKANYFSSGLGAHIDPSYTSSTMTDKSYKSPLSRFFGLASPRLPPRAALEKWEEPGDCWCSAPDSTMSGQTQLAVNVPYAMFPNQVTIEHIPKAAVPRKDVSNAPRDIELWVQSDAPANYHFDQHKNACGDGPKGFVCLGKFKYDIHGSNHVQTFNLDGVSTEPIKKAIVRVVNNWGSDHTCLYRVRLHGNDSDPDYEYNVGN